MTGRAPNRGGATKRRAATALPVPDEHAEQVALVQWAALSLRRYPALALLYAIPNGAERHPAVAARLRREGVRPGVPDLCLPVARGGYHGLYLELKRAKGGRVSPAQRGWHDALREQGYCIVLACGFEHARTSLEGYLALPQTVGTASPAILAELYQFDDAVLTEPLGSSWTGRS